MTDRESERIHAVNRFLTIEISKQKELHSIVTLAAEVCGTRGALISFIGITTQYIKFSFGSAIETIAREDSFCNYTIEGNGIMIVPDALHDDRFVNNPLVTKKPNIRFYAGIPLVASDGYSLGSLCVIDQSPKKLNRDQKQTLRLLSKQIVGILELEYSLHVLKKTFSGTNVAGADRGFTFENSTASYTLIGKDLKIIAYNNEFADFVKAVYHKNVIPDARLVDTFLSEFVDSYKKALNGTLVQIEKQVNHLNKMLWCRLVFAPVRNLTGEIAWVLFSAEDITDRVDLKQKLFKQNRSLEKIARIQSNEVKRLAASITGFMSIFKAENYVVTKEQLLIMQRAADELDRKIRQIINYTY